jgi:hypothetical protein
MEHDLLMTTREELFELLDTELHEVRARNVAAKLTDFHRTFGSSGYKAAMDIVTAELEDAGVDDLEIDEVDVERAYEPHDAELWIDAPDREKLIDFETAPASLATWSSSTPEGGERVEVVDVGTGERPADFVDVDVEGKAVFIHGTRRRQGWQKAAEVAAENGASGIVTDYMLWQTPGVREPALVPEVAQLLRLNPREFFLERDVWAFSIPHAASVKLQDRLDTGPVSLEVTIDAEVCETTAPLVEATIQGAGIPDEQILFCAHASGIRPGSNCAQGVGLTVELVRTIARLIESGAIDRPRRSIKFIFGSEGRVSRNFLDENPDAEETIVTSLTYCSTGHKQEETNSCLLLSRSPDSVRSFVNDYLAELADVSPKEADWIGKEAGKELPLIQFKQHYYTPWSDNTRFASAGIPAPLFMSWPDRYFHSQKLTEDVIDPAVLRRAGLLSGVAALELADADHHEAKSIGEIVAGRAVQRQSTFSSRYRTTDDVDAWATRRLEYLVDRDIDAMRSAAELTDEDVSATFDELEEELRETHERVVSDMPSPSREDPHSSADLVPVRTTDERARRWRGLDYEDLLEIADLLAEGDDDAGWESIRVVTDEAWNFIDGERTVGEIADSVGFEFDLRIEIEPIHRLLAGQADTGHLRFERPDEG